MRFEAFIALRYLAGRRKQAFIYLISLISVLGVSIGVAALVIVLGVYNGFTTDIREKILGANAHIILTGQALSAPDLAAPQGDSANVSSELATTLDRIEAVPGVVGATPFLYTEGMLSSPRGVKGVVLRGIDPSTAPNVLSILGTLSSGNVADLDPQSPGALPGVIVGRELALRLGLVPGSRVNLLSPAGQKTAAGFQPRIRPFRVAGVFQTGMYEYDSSLGFISLNAGRDLLALPEGRISGVEVTVKNVYEADKIADAIERELGSGIIARHWMEMNANLFAALKLERIGMFIVLAMVVLVGSFSIVTTLVMLVMEKTRDIAILKSMGATRSMIRRVFILQGVIIGAVGTLLGYALGIGIALLLQRYQFIKLPPGVYTLDHLPVLLNWTDIGLVGASAMLLCFLATLYPAGQAAGLVPAEALRYE